MKTLENVIEATDSALPNIYSLEQKIDWYNTVESIVCLTAMKRYGYIETTKTGNVMLPDGIYPEDIAAVFVDGKRAYGYDFKKGAINNKPDKKHKVSAAFIVRHSPVVMKKYSGKAVLKNESLELEAMPFNTGECIDITIIQDNEKGRVVVIGISGNVMYVANTDGSAAQLPESPEGKDVEIYLALTMKVLAPRPYDCLYIDYLSAQIYYYSKDFEAYNQAAERYNATLSNLKRYCTHHAPADAGANVRNLW